MLFMNFTKKGNDDEKEIYSDRTVGKDYLLNIHLTQ